MKFVCYFHWEQIPESADALFKQAEKHSIFYSRAWFENVAATLDDDQQMVLACVVTDKKVMAILPLIKDAGNYWHSLKHRYTTHYSLLFEEPVNAQDQLLTCLVQGLSQLGLRSLLLEPVDDKDSRIISLQQALEKQGFCCERLFRHYNWVYRVQGQSFEDYMAARPARLQNTIARKARKLEREHGYEIRLFTGAEVPQAMADYYAVYSASWKANEQYVNFVDGIVAGFSAPGLSDPGWSRLAILYVKEQPVAAQLWFVLHGKANIFRLAYDKIYKHYSPGSILTRYLMEYVIDTDKVEEIDFLTGNDAYKQDWMSERRERFALSCVKTARTASLFDKFVESLRSILKRR